MSSSSENVEPCSTTPPIKNTVRRPKNKALRDPAAPKRPMSAFFLFAEEQRPLVMAELGNISVGEIGKELGRRWAVLDKDKKCKYDAVYLEAKARYEEEMKTYQPSHQFLEMKAKREMEEKEAQKNNMAEYFSFVEINWKKVAKEQHVVDKGQLQAILWKIWCDGKGKSVDKKRNKKIDGIKKKKPLTVNNANQRTPTIDHDQKKTPTADKVETDGGAFSIFLEEMKKKLEAVSDKTFSNEEVRGLVSTKWKSLDQDLKNKYERMALSGSDDFGKNM